MSLRKRLRILLAALKQEWHQKTCAECSATWWAVGPERPELISICDACEVENPDNFVAFAEAEWRRIREHEERMN